MKLKRLLACTVLLLTSSLSHASVIAGYSATSPSTVPPFTPNTYDQRFDRFSTNFPTESPSTNTSGSFVLAARDLSGIGWISSDPLRRLTMITPKHFVAAAHTGLINLYTNGTSVSFLDASNNVVTATVQSATRVPSLGGPNPFTDIVFGTLMNDVPTGITSYALPSGTDAQFLNRPTHHYDQEHRVGLNRVTGLLDGQTVDGDTTNIVFFDDLPLAPTGFNPGEIFYTANDSGSPTMMITANGTLSLLGTHYGVFNFMGVNYSADAFLPDYISTISGMLPAGYNLTVVPVPEPGSFALVSITIVAGLVRRHLRRRAG
jgi:hypothetical protein